MDKVSHDDGSRKYVTLGEYQEEQKRGKPTPEGVLEEILIELEDADPDWIGARLQSLLDLGKQALGK